MFGFYGVETLRGGSWEKIHTQGFSERAGELGREEEEGSCVFPVGSRNLVEVASLPDAFAGFVQVHTDSEAYSAIRSQRLGYWFVIGERNQQVRGMSLSE